MQLASNGLNAGHKDMQNNSSINSTCGFSPRYQMLKRIKPFACVIQVLKKKRQMRQGAICQMPQLKFIFTAINNIAREMQFSAFCETNQGSGLFPVKSSQIAISV